MSLLRRIAAALSGALLLQLTLLASGTLCAMHAGDGMRGMMDAPAGRAAHAAVAPAAAATVAEATPAPSTDRGAPHDCDATGSQGDCGSPWSAGSCASMATCTATAAPSVLRIAEALQGHGAPSTIDPARIHSGPAAAPELPPPRA